MRKWLADLRDEAGFTQQELADKLNISRSHLSSIEVGTRLPGGRTAKKLADELGFDMNIFFEDNRLKSSQKTTA
ncbi:helix-turn-helix transcriptional regulator [Geomicrobium sediminis]|uniref:Transcriptional regulator with XRE-family HTH domain n=1 Tax=Geomicrobium sediminis TaxID=1347788 RepID=A0ABS2PG60_9BACL|nr:helix-turn-helix transcriptional regulator [Geomicrobium sediminis]MBM7634030.1 transcriptional regulator with XRE-family HTH domain [Geomicrobium sediminis]